LNYRNVANRENLSGTTYYPPKPERLMKNNSNVTTHISMKIDPKGSRPPRGMITHGSMNHFFSGMGLGTAFTRQG